MDGPKHHSSQRSTMATATLGALFMAAACQPPPPAERTAPGPHQRLPPAPSDPGALPSEAVPLDGEAWVPTRFKPRDDPALAPDPQRGWATADLSCPDPFQLPGAPLAMWFQYEDRDGSTGIGRATEGEDGWVVDPRPALQAEDLGLERLSCTSTAVTADGLRIWLSAAHPGEPRAIFQLRADPDGGLTLDPGFAPLAASEQDTELLEPAVIRDEGMWLLYTHMHSPQSDTIAMYDSVDGQNWELVTTAVMQASVHAEVEIPRTPYVTRRGDTYYLWVAVERHRHAPKDPELAASWDERAEEGEVDDVRYAVLYAASEDPSQFNFELNPIVLKPGRLSWKSVVVDGPRVTQKGDELVMLFRGTDTEGHGSIGEGRSQFRPKSNDGDDPTVETERLAPLGLPEGHVPAATQRRRDGDGGELLTVGELHHELLPIPAGSFLMGSPMTEVGRDPDETIHPVTITRPFLLGATEVTQELFEAVTGANPAEFTGTQRPVEQVSWNDAVVFCNLLSAAAGLVPAYQGSGNEVVWDHSANGYRLPTEAEWEYAARAGVESAPFAVDGALTESGWYKENSDLETHDVGALRPNPWGLYDMNGNVYEWVWDRKGHYRLEEIDPVGPDSDNLFRLERGGSFRNGERNCRLANRGRFEHYQRSFNLGFRLARNADEPGETGP